MRQAASPGGGFFSHNTYSKNNSRTAQVMAQSSSQQKFVHWFRSAAPYIHAFRDRTFVIAFGGEAMADGGFERLVHDFNLLASLGVRLVLVHGARPQIEARLVQLEHETRYVRELRVTDAVALQCAKEASGRLRVEIEALLSMGLPNSPMAGADIRVASGNFVTARPLGVIDGVDLLYTGEVRRIDAPAIQHQLDREELVLLSPLGYSPTGEVFNLTLEDVATAAAVALRAEKLIFLTEEAAGSRRGELLRELTAREAEALLGRKNARLTADARLYLPHAVRACRDGVKRVHLVSRRADGSLLLELFTHHGIGTMVTQDALRTLRPARIEDVGGILQLIEPLEADGTLLRRGREILETEIDSFYVVEHDGLIIGCAAFRPFRADRSAEIACLAVHPEYRNAGAGEHLLDEIEKRARRARLKQLFALTTRTAHWFVEHGFTTGSVDVLPPERRAAYSQQRRSKVLVKKL
jgi:amino-acid N-acetyltransferase